MWYSAAALPRALCRRSPGRKSSPRARGCVSRELTQVKARNRKAGEAYLVEAFMISPFEVCGIEAKARHCRARLSLVSDAQLRSFLQNMLEEAEQILAKRSTAGTAIAAKAGRGSDIHSSR